MDFGAHDIQLAAVMLIFWVTVVVSRGLEAREKTEEPGWLT
jgi:hypothetical protein